METKLEFPKAYEWASPVEILDLYRHGWLTTEETVQELEQRISDHDCKLKEKGFCPCTGVEAIKKQLESYLKEYGRVV